MDYSDLNEDTVKWRRDPIDDKRLCETIELPEPYRWRNGRRGIDPRNPRAMARTVTEPNSVDCCTIFRPDGTMDKYFHKWVERDTE